MLISTNSLSLKGFRQEKFEDTKKKDQ